MLGTSLPIALKRQHDSLLIKGISLLIVFYLGFAGERAEHTADAAYVGVLGVNREASFGCVFPNFCICPIEYRLNH